MRQFYRFDPLGYYLPGLDYLAECVEEGSTEVAPVTEDGKGMYKARFVSGKWIDEGAAPPLVPQEPTVSEDVRILQAQIKASNDYMDFLEEVIVEMAQVVYK